jgi:hypothetical protein
MREGPWLPSVVVLGAVVLWVVTIYVAFYPAVVITVIVVTVLRVLSVRQGWTSPVFPGDDLHSGIPDWRGGMAAADVASGSGLVLVRWSKRQGQGRSWRSGRGGRWRSWGRCQAGARCVGV